MPDAPPWARLYPPGTTGEPDTEGIRHIGEIATRAAERYGDARAFTTCMPNGMNGRLSFRELDLMSDRFAAWLRGDLKLAAGDRVAVQLPNCLSYPVAVFGVLKAGCVLVNTNPLYTGRETGRQLADAGVSALVVMDMFADRLPEALRDLPGLPVVVARIAEFFPRVVDRIITGVQKHWSRQVPAVPVPHTRFREALDAGAAILKAEPDIVTRYTAGLGPESLACLQYTGGTTGTAKGAMLGHGNILANMAQTFAMCGDRLKRGEETILTALPMYHIFAFTVSLLGFLHAGAHNVLVPSPRPLSNLKRALENYPVSWLIGVNTLFNGLCNELWFREYPPRRLRNSIAGGMALHRAVAERWREVSGTAIVEGYGLTETSPVLTVNPFDHPRDESVGIPVPATELCSLGPDGAPLPPGEAGELAARGPQVMSGYWNRPEETAAVLSRDGWFRTGDVGYQDADGYFFLVDRVKDMINVSGFNVYPNELEERLAEHPDVLEAGVIGVADAERGEIPVAYVVAGNPAPTAEALIEHCKETLTFYKVPRRIVFVEDLPKSPVGKILRRELRAAPPPPITPSPAAAPAAADT